MNRRRAVLLSLFLLSASAWASTVWISASGHGRSPAQARWLAPGLVPAGNLPVTDSRRVGLMWQAGGAGNCGERLQIRL